MIFVYILTVLFIIGAALWALVSFNDVMQQRKDVNALWEEAATVLSERSLILDEILGYSEQQDFGLSTNDIDQWMTEEERTDWTNVAHRAKLHASIDAQAYVLIDQLKENPAISQHPELQGFLRLFEENGVALLKTITSYNAYARDYNQLLQRGPNRFLARFLGFIPVPYYRAA